MTIDPNLNINIKPNSVKQLVYGIDLGTTYSCIAKYDGQHLSTIQPRGAMLGSTVLQSVVYFNEQD